MYVLDTNIVSLLDPRRHATAPVLVDWIKRHGSRLYLSVMTIAELESGHLKLHRKGNNKRADEVAAIISGILTDFGDRILPIDLATAQHLARLGEATYQQTVAFPDLVIAASAARHGFTVVTRNMADFAKIPVPAINPYVALPPVP